MTVIPIHYYIKDNMIATMIEIVCDNIREAYTLLKEQPEVDEVVAEGDTLRFALSNECHHEEEVLHSWLKDLGLLVRSIKTIPTP